MKSIWGAFKEIRDEYPYLKSLEFYFMDVMEEIMRHKKKSPLGQNQNVSV